MKRRELFKHMLLLGMGAILPVRHLLSARKEDVNPRYPYHRMQLGELELLVLTDGALHFDTVQPIIAPVVDSVAVNSLLRDSFRATDRVDMSMNILLIKKGQQRILIDSGAEPGLGKESGWLPKALVAAGIKPQEITDIVLSHAHPDHIGGLLRADGSLTFPNARLYLSGVEYAFWTAAQQDFSKSKFPDKRQLEAIKATIKSSLATLRPRLHFFKPSEELFGCIRLELAAGHTPGHTLVHVFSGGDELVHIADLMHSDVLLFPHPEWGFFGDTDFDQAVATRRKILGELVAGRKKTFGYHLPWPGLGHVRRRGDAYEWVPEVYAHPG